MLTGLAKNFFSGNSGERPGSKKSFSNKKNGGGDDGDKKKSLGIFDLPIGSCFMKLNCPLEITCGNGRPFYYVNIPQIVGPPRPEYKIKVSDILGNTSHRADIFTFGFAFKIIKFVLITSCCQKKPENVNAMIVPLINKNPTEQDIKNRALMLDDKFNLDNRGVKTATVNKSEFFKDELGYDTYLNTQDYMDINGTFNIYTDKDVSDNQGKWSFNVEIWMMIKYRP